MGITRREATRQSHPTCVRNVSITIVSLGLLSLSPSFDSPTPSSKRRLSLMTNVHAQSRPLAQPKRLRGQLNESEASESFNETLRDMLSDSANSHLYDSLTLLRLRRLKEQAEPLWSGDEIDYEESRYVAQKAGAIQLGKELSRLLQQSELRNVYRSLRRGLSKLRRKLSLSLHQTPDGFEVEPKEKAQKILEFALEPDTDAFLEPQIRIGPRLRFRYDHREETPMLEYGIEF